VDRYGDEWISAGDGWYLVLNMVGSLCVVYCLRRYYVDVKVSWSIWWSPLYLQKKLCQAVILYMYIILSTHNGMDIDDFNF
jgi:hypothetical protein